VVAPHEQDDGAKQGLDDFLVLSGRDQLINPLDKAEPLGEWACRVVTVMPGAHKRKGLDWLTGRLKSLDATYVEFLVDRQHKSLGLSKPTLRQLLKQASIWTPSPPKVEREAAAQRERQAQEEANVRDEAAARRAAETEERAKALLKNPALLYRLGEVLDRLGLAGEARNSRIVYLVITSRILTSPISLTVKGESSEGKSFLVLMVLRLFPEEAYLVLTSMSRQALVYSQESISHRSVVILERPGMEAADYNIRTLQSEGKIIFDTVERDPATNHQMTVRVEKEGPTNFIFTTTAPQIHQENETRHWSIFIDESEEQTGAIKGKIANSYSPDFSPVPEKDLVVWRMAQTLLQPARVVIPYAQCLAEHTPNIPLRMRRDFTRLLALIETIALLHQYQRAVQEVEGTRAVRAGLADYYIARVLVGDAFGGDVQGRNAKVTEVVEAVSRLYQEKLLNGSAEPSVTVAEIAHELGKVQSTVLRWLKPALDHGWVIEVNPAGGRKGAEYAPASPCRICHLCRWWKNWRRPSRSWPRDSLSSTPDWGEGGLGTNGGG
jgi:hypothetical protein